MEITSLPAPTSTGPEKLHSKPLERLYDREPFSNQGALWEFQKYECLRALIAADHGRIKWKQ